MAKMTMVFAVLLIVLGTTVFVMMGQDDPALLIPAFFGLVLLLCGSLSFNRRRRQIWMPIAVVSGFIGFIFPLARGVQAIVSAYSENDELAQPLAVVEELLMAALCLLFTGLCVRRFLAADKARAV